MSTLTRRLALFCLVLFCLLLGTVAFGSGTPPQRQAFGSSADVSAAPRQLTASFLSTPLLLTTGVELADPKHAIEAGSKALDSFVDYPWYDDATDGIRPITVQAPKPPPPPRNSRWWNGSLGNWFPEGLFRGATYLLVGALLIVVAYALFRAYQERDIRRDRQARQRAEAASRRGHADRVDALPFDLASTTADLLAEARRCYDARDYQLAIVYLYSHELVELDKHNLILLAKGKTNRQYLQEVGPTDPLGRILGATIVLFEKGFFGHHTIERRQFEQCWNDLTEFNRLLTKTRQEQAV